MGRVHGEFGLNPFTLRTPVNLHHVSRPVHTEHSPDTEGEVLVELRVRPQGLPGPQGPRRGGHQELAPVHHRDPARRVPRPQALVRQARVTDVRQAPQSRNCPPSPLSFPTHTIGSSLWATPTCPSPPRSTAPTEPRLPACPKLQTWHPITHHEPWFFFPKFHFRTQGWEATFWPRTEIVTHSPPPLLVVRLEFRLTRRIDDNVY